MKHTPLMYGEFANLSAYHRVKLLSQIDMEYVRLSPQLCEYLLSFMREFRVRIKEAPLSLSIFTKPTMELYYALRSSLMLCDIEHNLNALQETKDVTQRELCLLTEFAEDILMECFNALHWSETHQKQLNELHPAIERQHLIRFSQEVMRNARIIGVEKCAQITVSILQLLQSLPKGQSITEEQLNALFEVK
jgi:hypothetical protein